LFSNDRLLFRLISCFSAAAFFSGADLKIPGPEIFRFGNFKSAVEDAP